MTVVIDGTTGIDAVQNGTVAQADLAANVAGNGPAFSAYQSSLQTLGSATNTKILFQSSDFITNSSFDTSTSRFTPNIAGYYMMTAQVQFATGSYATRIIFYKNGGIAAYGASGTVVTQGSFLIYLNGTTDYIEIYATTATGQNTTTGVGITFFQAALVRAA